MAHARHITGAEGRIVRGLGAGDAEVELANGERRAWKAGDYVVTADMPAASLKVQGTGAMQSAPPAATSPADTAAAPPASPPAA